MGTDHLEKRIDEVVRRMRDLMWEVVYLNPLSGMRNQRGLDVDLAQLSPPLALIAADVNGLKALNHYPGPEKADLILNEIGRRLREIADDRGAAAYHLHGDEFALQLPEATRAGAAQSAELLRRRINDNPFDVPGVAEAIPVTVAVAVAHVDAGCGQPDVRQVWDQLHLLTEYQKQHGRSGEVLKLWDEAERPEYARFLEAEQSSARVRFECRTCLSSGYVNLTPEAKQCPRCSAYFEAQLA